MYALDQKLWAHAMVIASSIDKDAWKEVVNEFIQTELGRQEEAPVTAHPGSSDSQSSGRDSLRVAYRFFSGQAAGAGELPLPLWTLGEISNDVIVVQELIPKQSFSRPAGNLLQPTTNLAAQPQLTPRTPAFPSVPSNTVAPESFSKWRETVAMIIASPQGSDASVTLTALGDQLMAYHWLEASHIW